MQTMKMAGLALFLLVLGGLIWIVTSKLLRPAQPQSIFSALVSERNFRLVQGVSYGTHARHQLDLYEPASGRGRAVVIFVYGGGWKSGDLSTYGFVGAALASRGYSVVIPNYRLYPEVKFPEFMKDLAQAYAHVQRNIADDRQIFLMGHSAGAHMAALLAVDPQYLKQAGQFASPPAGLIGLAGPYAFDPTSWPTTESIFDEARSPDAARPVAHVSSSAPPTLMMHGLDDTTVRLWNMEKMDATLDAARVPSSAIELDGVGHVGIMLAISRPFRWRAPVLPEILQFLETWTRSR